MVSGLAPTSSTPTLARTPVGERAGQGEVLERENSGGMGAMFNFLFNN